MMLIVSDYDKKMMAETQKWLYISVKMVGVI